MTFIAHKGMNISEFERSCGLANAYVRHIRQTIMPDKLEAILSVYPELNVALNNALAECHVQHGGKFSPILPTGVLFERLVIEIRLKSLEPFTGNVREGYIAPFISLKVYEGSVVGITPFVCYGGEYGEEGNLPCTHIDIIPSAVYLDYPLRPYAFRDAQRMFVGNLRPCITLGKEIQIEVFVFPCTSVVDIEVQRA